jgi:hypothetical protein|tara:strand:- start:318 stop:557 length:240 start_codon:yes stop_codon:yes gene_type:complete
MAKKIAKKELTELQEHISKLNRVQIRIGELEITKIGLISQFNNINQEVKVFQQKLEKKYGAVNINVNTGEINDETNKKN